MSDYKLTVIMPSHNQAQYIEYALKSVLEQETKYAYKIIIADDCSNDETIQIVESYQKKYSNIEILKSDKNQGLFKNIIRAYELCKTDYFCVLDSDDYWIDKNKIQKAIDYLEKNKDYVIYFTNSLKLNLDGELEKYTNLVKKHITFDLFLKNDIEIGATAGTVFRNVIFKNGLPKKIAELSDKQVQETFRGDTFRNLIHLKEGKAYCSKDYDSVYRITKQGLWQSKTYVDKLFFSIQVHLNIYKYLDEKYPELLLKAYRLFLHLKSDNEYHQIIKETEKFDKYIEYELYFNQYKFLLDSMLIKSLGFKDKVLLLIYRILKKNLKEKSIV